MMSCCVVWCYVVSCGVEYGCVLVGDGMCGWVGLCYVVCCGVIVYVDV